MCFHISYFSRAELYSARAQPGSGPPSLKTRRPTWVPPTWDGRVVFVDPAFLTRWGKSAGAGDWELEAISDWGGGLCGNAELI